MGRMAAEYATAVDTPNCVTCYLSADHLGTDHLGTARLITDQNGLVVSRHDYLPFGEEILAGQAGRNAAWGPGGDSVNQKFTGKERDSESGLPGMGLDYFGARYYGSGLGRFTSPDKPLIGQEPSDPQSWDMYAYTANNPLSRVDPNGERYFVCLFNVHGQSTWCRPLDDGSYEGLRQQQNGKQGITLPGGSGAIKCGDTVCGSVTYVENGIEDESASIGVGVVTGGIASKLARPVLGRLGGLVAGLFGRAGGSALAGKVLVGFSEAQVAMIEKAFSALEAAGYNMGKFTELYKGDFNGRMAGMSLGENGAALSNEAFESQAMLNHTLEEEFLHTQQAARGLSAGSPGAADALEAEVDAIRKFPAPRKN